LRLSYSHSSQRIQTHLTFTVRISALNSHRNEEQNTQEEYLLPANSTSLVPVGPQEALKIRSYKISPGDKPRQFGTQNLQGFGDCIASITRE
jgi:hypothetical protein